MRHYELLCGEKRRNSINIDEVAMDHFERNEKCLKPLVGQKLTNVEFRGNMFVLSFDNNRTFTGIVQLNMDSLGILPDVKVICGYTEDCSFKE